MFHFFKWTTGFSQYYFPFFFFLFFFYRLTPLTNSEKQFKVKGLLQTEMLDFDL